MEGARLESRERKELPPRPQWVEFGGTLGSAFCTLLLPLLLLGWHYTMLYTADAAHPREVRALDVGAYLSSSIPRAKEWMMLGGWFVFQAILQQYAPGTWAEGLPLRRDPFDKVLKRFNKSTVQVDDRLWYHCNGLASFAITTIVLAGLYATGLFSPSTVVNAYDRLLVGSIIISIAMSAFLYLQYPLPSHLLSRWERFYMGACRHPRFEWPSLGRSTRIDARKTRSYEGKRKDRRFDLKFFCEGRPGLFGWMLLNACFVCEQWQQRGTVEVSLMVVCVSQLLYVLDYLYFESAILSIHDITTERFGFMMVFGDLSWVPFGFSIHCRYLFLLQPDSSRTVLLLSVALQVFGYLLFRIANLQKHRFWQNPYRPLPLWPWKSTISPRTIPSIESSTLDRAHPVLLCDGLWALSRHPNYLGDYCLGLGWCLSCGVESVLPYFYAIYFLPTLIHRERRDYYNCYEQFGGTFLRYCHVVPSRIVPFVY